MHVGHFLDRTLRIRPKGIPQGSPQAQNLPLPGNKVYNKAPTFYLCPSLSEPHVVHSLHYSLVNHTFSNTHLLPFLNLRSIYDDECTGRAGEYRLLSFAITHQTITIHDPVCLSSFAITHQTIKNGPSGHFCHIFFRIFYLS